MLSRIVRAVPFVLAGLAAGGCGKDKEPKAVIPTDIPTGPPPELKAADGGGGGGKKDKGTKAPPAATAN